MSLGTMEQRTEGMKKQAQELIEQAYQRGYRAGYSKAENDYHAKTEDDRQSSYELGLNMAWEAARKLVSMGYKECNEVLGDGILTVETIDEIFVRCTASEAIEKLCAYEEQKKQEEDSEIRVGDEVILNGNSSFDTNTKAIVIALYDKTDYRAMFPYNVMIADGDTDWIDRDDIDRKTGRHFPEIVEVLKKIQ